MIRQLAAVVEALDAAADNPSTLPALLSTLVEDTDGLFSAAVLFKGGYAGGSFVTVTERGISSVRTRLWLRWPLQRLFTRMKPARIRNVFDKESLALAIPFSYGSERYVVVAPLTEKELTPLHGTFFDVLERMTIPDGGESPSSDIPQTPTQLRVAAFALPTDLYERLERMVRQRGWSIEHLLAYGDLTRRFEEERPDVVVIDAEALVDPLAAVTSIHRIANSASLRLIAFADEPIARHGSAPLVDHVLPHDADDESIFLALKELARDTRLVRRAVIADMDRAAKTVTTALTLQELAEFAAQRAAELMRGWASCVLIDEYGAVSRAECPARHPLVFSAIPNTIFRQGPLFDLHVDEAFLRELTDDAFERMALMALQPFSGASAPISGSGEPCGVLTGCSLRGWADSRMFEAFERLSQIVGARYRSLQPRRREIPEFRQERGWQQMRDRTFGLEVYRSGGCRTPWRYRALSSDAGLLTLGLADDSGLHAQLSADKLVSDATLALGLSTSSGGLPAFAGIVDFCARSIRFAAGGFSPPIALDRPGPAASIQMVAGMTTGSATLGLPGGALVCDAKLWRWLDSQRSGELRQLLDTYKPAGLASIVRLDSRRP